MKGSLKQLAAIQAKCKKNQFNLPKAAKFEAKFSHRVVENRASYNDYFQSET
jgi:hypothetical protein